MEKFDSKNLRANSDAVTGDEKSLKKFQSIATESLGWNNLSKAVIFDNLVWMNTADTARYLRKSVGAIRVMVCRGQIKAYRFHNRLLFKRSELDKEIERPSNKGAF